MAEKSSELDERSGVLSDTDEKIVSTVASSSDDEFVERYTEDVSASDRVTDDEATEEETDETEQIREQIEETRRGMSETIDAIQEKFSIQNITEQVKDTVTEQVSSALETAKDSVYGATIGKAGEFMKKVGRELSKSEAGKVAANNPFPLLLIGLGIGLLAYQGFSGKKRRTYERYEDYDLDYERTGNSSRSYLKSAQGKIGDVAGNTYESVSGAASSAYESVTDATGAAYEGVSKTAKNAYSGVTDYAQRGYEKIGDLGTQARETYSHQIEENPLAVGAVALAVGAAVGFSIPSSRYEGQLMGEYRQNLIDKAQTAAGDLVDRVKEVAGEAQKTIKDEVKAQGLTGENGGAKTKI